LVFIETPLRQAHHACAFAGFFIAQSAAEVNRQSRIAVQSRQQSSFFRIFCWLIPVFAAEIRLQQQRSANLLPDCHSLAPRLVQAGRKMISRPATRPRPGQELLHIPLFFRDMWLRLGRWRGFC
jgi:hypothetical protein